MSTALELAEKIAVELGEGWVTEVGTWGDGTGRADAWLRGPDGVSVHAITEQHGLPKGRVKLDGTATDFHVRDAMIGLGDRHGRRTITVVGTKSPAQMAREVTSRLLPNTRAYVADGVARLDASREYAADLRAFTSAMTAANPAFQVSPVHSRDSLPSNMIVGSYGDKVYGDMRINGTVQFDRLIMGRKTALMFAEWLAAHTRG